MDSRRRESAAGSSHGGSGDEPSPSPSPSTTCTVAPTLPEPPSVPDTIMWNDEMLHSDNLVEVIAIAGSGYVYRCAAGCVYKMVATPREFSMMQAAGDCSVRPLSRVMERIEGQTCSAGILVELATPFDFRAVAPCDRGAVKDEMVALVERLHDEYGLVHGDIKPDNFVRCRDGKLRLCDFAGARRIAGDGDERPWEFAGHTMRYMSPHCDILDTSPPTKDDDWYALAVSLWELYMGEDALKGITTHMAFEPNFLRPTIDWSAVADDDAREYIRRIIEHDSAQAAAQGKSARRAVRAGGRAREPEEATAAQQEEVKVVATPKYFLLGDEDGWFDGR
ncbi:kinase-like domain-containing protein [Lasiosphaeria hispida]|uniref:Kinase-like domain-containing protein n=1 Tax=Lasiosphaeria hispida TaxID=260671 RepID=A0AAJ0MBQ7_9PEZI|nr:kinase-like domain-containing protein [Lasiosphaeria hispida]